MADMRAHRLNQMEQFIMDNKNVSFDELCQKFNISTNTARRDIKELLKSGNIVKVYGGVSYPERTNALPFEQRNARSDMEKRGIAKAAAGQIQADEIIFIDSGTTTQYILDYVPDELSFTLVTYSVNAILSALHKPNIRLIVLPGELARKTNSLCNTDTAIMLESYSVHRAFMAATSVTREGKVGNSFTLEYEIKKMAVSRSSSKTLLIDSTKYGPVSLRAYASLADFDTVITGEDIAPDFLGLCQRMDVTVIQVPLLKEKG